MSGSNGLEGGVIELDRIPTTPISEKVKRTSFQLPEDLLEELAEAAKILSDRAKRDGRLPFDRDDVIAHACRWWLQAWRADNAKKPKE